MGDFAEPFRDVSSAHLDMGASRKPSHEVGDDNSDLGARNKAFGELGGFNFDMGDHRVASGDGAEASCAASYGIEAFFELSDAAKSLCEVGHVASCEADTICEEGDEPNLGWGSPRISFSQDLTMGESEAPRSSRVYPEKRKWQEEGVNGEPDDGFSADFDFLNNGVMNDGFAQQTKGVMLSADELFSDGKLLPMHTQQTASSLSASYGDLCTSRSKLTLQESHLSASNSQEAYQKPTARHLSLDLPKPASSSIAYALAPLSSLSVDSSPCSSPPRTVPTPPAVSLTTPFPHKASSKSSFRIKDFFKPKRVSSSVNAQLTRDNSITATSTCRIPIPPRSFWPFSRSNSAGESKTTTPPRPTLPPRSNSAGESNTSRVSPACKPSNQAQILKKCNTSSTSHVQDPMVSAREDAVNACTDVGSLNQSTESSNQADDDGESIQNAASTSQDGRKSNSGRTARKKYMYSTANFLRGSPGRRGGMNSLVKVNASRIVLKNLERCSADRKLCRESSGRRAVAYPVAVRVSPVLNVAVYRGKMPSSGMFGLKSLFSSKKEKTKEKEATINNWRVGA
eukprot:c16655_g1_i1 orf=43-1749(-)